MSKLSRSTSTFDADSVRREIEYITRRAQLLDSRLVVLGPLLFFSTETGDAWMLDPSDDLATCLARGGEPQPVRIEDREERLGIEWTCSYRIEGEAMVFFEQETARVRTILGYPVRDIARAVRGMQR